MPDRSPGPASRRRLILARLGALGAFALSACGHPPTTAPLRFEAADVAPTTAIAGLAACSPRQPAVQDIDPDRPLVVLVHGCYSSGGRFRSLADVFELHGQQTLCFNYDDRDSLAESGGQLRAALAALRPHMRDPRVTVVGHSQGGLVARAAFSGAGPAGSLGEAAGDYRLVTVSSPFAGVDAAADCGRVLLHVATLGITVGVCQIASGSNWNEIHPRARMVVEPPALSPVVESHLAVVTDERNTCRRRGPDGACLESDFVFEVAEQENAKLMVDDRVQQVAVAAGHVEIVGTAGVRPEKLLRALQAEGILAPTPLARRAALARLLARLY
ncbi:MAG: esterase/lipase family protein [Myxococcota bacterium]